MAKPIDLQSGLNVVPQTPWCTVTELIFRTLAGRLRCLSRAHSHIGIYTRTGEGGGGGVVEGKGKMLKKKRKMIWGRERPQNISRLRKGTMKGVSRFLLSYIPFFASLHIFLQCAMSVLPSVFHEEKNKHVLILYFEKFLKTAFSRNFIPSIYLNL